MPPRTTQERRLSKEEQCTLSAFFALLDDDDLAKLSHLDVITSGPEWWVGTAIFKEVTERRRLRQAEPAR